MKLAFIFSIVITLIIAVFSRKSLRGDDKDDKKKKAAKVNGGFGRNSKKVEKFKPLEKSKKLANAGRDTVL